MAQWERAGPITQRSMDRNHPLLAFFFRFYVPFSVHVFFFFEYTFSLKRHLLRTPFFTNHCTSTFFFRYLEKCTEFFRAFVSSHLRRIESNPHFSVVEFLTLFLKYSLKQVITILLWTSHTSYFEQPHLDGYYLCLDIWIVFLDHVISMSSNSTVSVEK